MAINTAKMDAEFLEWFLKHLKSISGSRVDDNLGLTKLYKPILTGQISLQTIISSSKTTSSRLSTVETPFLDSRISQIHLLSDGQQARVFSVKRQISFINQKIDQLAEWNKMTFEITDPGNHALCIGNENSSAEAAFRLTRQLVDEVHSYFLEPNLA